ncbi:hypothetical protein BGZ65_003248, partial [Modicella reniformis]
EKDGKVFIYCSDNTSYEGDILVGADGTYSGVRQSFYKQLDAIGELPKSDLEDFEVGSAAMVGVAEPKDPEKYPQLKDKFCHFSNVMGRASDRGWSAMNAPDNQICWVASTALPKTSGKAQLFRNSEWGPESIDTTYKEFENLPCPWVMLPGAGLGTLGYEQLIFARSKLYEVLQNRVPAHMISRNKRVLRITEKDNKIHIHRSDNTHYQGNILIGADGTHSGVRHSLFKQLEDQGLLPKEDSKDFVIDAVVMVAIAELATAEELEKYPQLKGDVCHFSNLMEGDSSRVALVVSLPNNQICWTVAEEISENEVGEAQQFRNTEWEPMSIDDMYKDFENTLCPWGGKMGEIMESAQGSVNVERKLNHGRTVLMGEV